MVLAGRPPVARLGSGLRDRRDRRLRRDRLPLVLELVARDLRSGTTLNAALTRVARADGTGLAEAVGRIERGEPTVAALDRWLSTFPADDAALVGGVFQLGLRTGVATADALDRAAASLRVRHEVLAEVRALTAQSRASALVVAIAPVGFLTLVATADADASAFLFTTPGGWACLVVGLSLDAAGFWWMRRLVGRVVS